MPARKTPAAVVSEAEEVVEQALAEVPSTNGVEKPAFDPAKHLSKVSGKDYLEVKWRLVWLRDVEPESVIETEMVTYQNNEAVFRAKVSLPSGASATGWGSETKSDFGDYLEKAETKALGRALAALGYGTQFSDDFAFGADKGKVVDSPVSRSSSNSNGGSSGSQYRPSNPASFPPQNVPGGWACETCGEALTDSPRKDGSGVFEAGAKAANSVKNVGSILCYKHLIEEKERRAG